MAREDDVDSCGDDEDGVDGSATVPAGVDDEELAPGPLSEEAVSSTVAPLQAAANRARTARIRNIRFIAVTLPQLPI